MNELQVFDVKQAQNLQKIYNEKKSDVIKYS